MIRSIRWSSGVAYALAVVMATACAGPGSAPAAPAPQAGTLPNDIRWVRNSAEYRAIAQQTYRLATVRVAELSRGLAANSWAVILDADETVLDNSESQRRLAVAHQTYTEAGWARWVDERAATAIPGAREFIDAVHAAGGIVAIVTNRADSLCAATRDNLGALRLTADIVLCKGSSSDKNPRFAAVQQGTAVTGIGPLNVIAWVGDNIQDFPGLSQASRGDTVAMRDFGVRYFMLPNPMYGSWEKL